MHMPGMSEAGEIFICLHLVMVFMPANSYMCICYEVNKRKPVMVSLPPLMDWQVIFISKLGGIQCLLYNSIRDFPKV